jgi:hypothetical protein
MLHIVTGATKTGIPVERGEKSSMCGGNRVAPRSSFDLTGGRNITGVKSFLYCRNSMTEIA